MQEKVLVESDELNMLPVGKEEAPDFFRVAREVERHGRTLLGRERLYTLWQAVGNAHHSPGALVEIGAYRGGSSYFLANALKAHHAPDKHLHVVDTFEGYPSFVTEDDHKFHPPGHFADTSFEEVKDYLDKFPYVTVHKGPFEEVHPSIPEQEFCFAHIDVATYTTTKSCLAFFDSHLSRGAVLVLGDFGASKCPGVKAAALEFLDGRRDRYLLMRLHTEQALLVRL